MKIYGKYIWLYVILELIACAFFVRLFSASLLFFEMFLSACIGVFLLIKSRSFAINELKKLMRGEINSSDFLRANISRIMGAFFMILPGILSDIIGGFLVAKSFVVRGVDPKNSEKMGKKTQEFIDVEVIELPGEGKSK